MFTLISFIITYLVRNTAAYTAGVMITTIFFVWEFFAWFLVIGLAVLFMGTA